MVHTAIYWILHSVFIQWYVTSIETWAKLQYCSVWQWMLSQRFAQWYEQYAQSVIYIVMWQYLWQTPVIYTVMMCMLNTLSEMFSDVEECMTDPSDIHSDDVYANTLSEMFSDVAVYMTVSSDIHRDHMYAQYTQWNVQITCSVMWQYVWHLVM